MSTPTIWKNGYSLWAFTDSLDNFARPYTVVALPSPDSRVLFYQVRFDTVPHFKSFGLDVSEDNVIYMSDVELLHRGDVVPVFGGDWNSSSSIYHSIGAFYYLGIIPSLSSALFNDPDRILQLQKDLWNTYNLKDHQTYTTSLTQIFENSFLALQFFGYLETHDEKEKNSIKYAESIYKQRHTFSDPKLLTFPFGNIRDAIARYHTACFSTRMQSPQIFTPLSFQLLTGTLDLVIMLMQKLNVPISQPNDRRILLKALQNFQKRRKISEVQCGPKTLMALLFDAALRDESILLTSAGFKTSEPPNRNSIKPQFLNSNLDAMLYKMPNLENEKYVLSNEIALKLGSANSTSEILRERIENAEERIKLISMSLNQLSLVNTRILRELDQTAEKLTDVLNEHIKVQEQIFALKGKIAFERRMNKFLLGCALIIILNVLYQFIKFI